MAQESDYWEFNRSIVFCPTNKRKRRKSVGRDSAKSDENNAENLPARQLAIRLRLTRAFALVSNGDDGNARPRKTVRPWHSSRLSMIALTTILTIDSPWELSFACSDVFAGIFTGEVQPIGSCDCCLARWMLSLLWGWCGLLHYYSIIDTTRYQTHCARIEMRWLRFLRCCLFCWVVLFVFVFSQFLISAGLVGAAHKQKRGVAVGSLCDTLEST